MRFNTEELESSINDKDVAALLLQPGVYDYEVVVAEDTVSKSSGNDMIKVKIKVWAMNGSVRYVYDYLLAAFAHKLKHFCQNTNLMDAYNSGELKALDCVGKTGKVKIDIEKGTGTYQDKNVVRDYVKGSSNDASMQNTKKAEGFLSDDVPF